MWRKLAGGSVAMPYAAAAGSGNRNIGPEDHGVWTVHFGETVEQGAGNAANSEPLAASLSGAAPERQAEPDLPASEFPIADFGLRIEKG